MSRNGFRFAVTALESGALGTMTPLTLPQGPNQPWLKDFLHDQLSDGTRLRILAAVEDFTPEYLVAVAVPRCPACEVKAIIAERGKPRRLCLRQRHRANQHGNPALVSAEPCHYIASGKPQQKAFI
jgi:putative transposase